MILFSMSILDINHDEIKIKKYLNINDEAQAFILA
jgi:hypothetical protein